MPLCQALKSQRTLWNKMGGPWFSSEAILWTFLLIVVGRYSTTKSKEGTRKPKNQTTRKQFSGKWKVIENLEKSTKHLDILTLYNLNNLGLPWTYVHFLYILSQITSSFYTWSWPWTFESQKIPFCYWILPERKKKLTTIYFEFGVNKRNPQLFKLQADRNEA